MPRSKIPKVLKDMLNKLLEDTTIVSWNIRGEQNLTMVSIRFSDKMAADMDISYKKVPQSRFRRDLKRKQEWQDRRKGITGNVQSDLCVDETKTDTNKSNKGFEDPPLNKGTSQLSLSDKSSTEVNHSKPTETTNPSQYRNQQDVLCLKNAGTQYVSCENVNSGQDNPPIKEVPQTAAVTTIGSEKVNNDDNVDNNEEQDEYYAHEICRGCETLINEDNFDTLFQCMYCEDFFLCSSCKETYHHADHPFVELNMKQYQTVIDLSFW